jgi:hypothetical protein
MDRKSKTGIYKHTITITVLADVDDISDYTIGDLARQMDYGDFMGINECTDITNELTLSELDEDCTMMGGGVGFFDPEFEVIYE